MKTWRINSGYIFSFDGILLSLRKNKKNDIVVIAVAERHQKEIVNNLSLSGVNNWKQFIV